MFIFTITIHRLDILFMIPGIGPIIPIVGYIWGRILITGGALMDHGGRRGGMLAFIIPIITGGGGIIVIMIPIIGLVEGAVLMYPGIMPNGRLSDATWVPLVAAISHRIHNRHWRNQRQTSSLIGRDIYSIRLTGAIGPQSPRRAGSLVPEMIRNSSEIEAK